MAQFRAQRYSSLTLTHRAVVWTKKCQVELRTEGSATVVITSLASDWRTALDQSLSRAIRTLTRSQQKRQKPERGRLAKQTLSLES